LEYSKKKTITIRTKTEENNVTIEIQDSGPGIPEEIQSRIFEPFYTTKPVGKGTGLGLSLSYSMLKENEASIHFTTEKDLGTCFVITIPLYKD